MSLSFLANGYTVMQISEVCKKGLLDECCHRPESRKQQPVKSWSCKNFVRSSKACMRATSTLDRVLWFVRDSLADFLTDFLTEWMQTSTSHHPESRQQQQQQPMRASKQPAKSWSCKNPVKASKAWMRAKCEKHARRILWFVNLGWFIDLVDSANADKLCSIKKC